MRVTWIGGPTTLLAMGAFRVLLDPVFADDVEMPTGRSSRSAPAPGAELDDLQVVCLTSIRPDHFDPSSLRHIDANTPVLVPSGAASAVGAAGFGDVREVAWYESVTLERSGETLAITAVPAKSPSGDDSGWFFRHESGGAVFTAYCTGDALWSDEIRNVQRQLGHSNLLLQNVGAERSPEGELCSPDGKEAMQFVYRMQPNGIVPIHHGTYSHYTETVQAFAEQLGRTIYDRRLHVLAEGESWEK